MLTKLDTYLVLKRIWNLIYFQGHRSRSPGQIVRRGDTPRFALLLFQFKIYIYEYEDKQITSYLTGNE